MSLLCTDGPYMKTSARNDVPGKKKDPSFQDFLREVINRNRNAHANTILYVPFVGVKKKFTRLYDACVKTLENLKIRSDLNGGMRFARKVNMHLTWGGEQETLEYLPPPSGPGTAFRVVRVLDCNLKDRMVHYVETWYARDIYDEYEDERDKQEGDGIPLL